MAAPPPGTRAPRDVITEDALFVHPSLLGLPLARPWRRGAAMAVDGLLVSLLTQAPSVLFGFAAALVLFRVSAPAAARSGFVGRWTRRGLRLGGAVALFAATVSTWNSATDRFEAGLASLGGAAAETPEESSTTVIGVNGIRAGADLALLSSADNEPEARSRGEAAVARLREAGVEPSDIEDALTGIVEASPEKPWLAAIADSLLRPAHPAAPALDADSLTAAYGAALAAGDQENAAAIRPLLATALAADSLAELNRELAQLRRNRAELNVRVDELEHERDEAGLVAMLKRFADDLGLGLGWMGLYFTATLALWRGRTPGKRLFGIRVIRLDGKPIGWWVAFERAGGYWAGVATGLLGFFQILWDRNRQAIHDKITETAVVREA